MIQNRRVLLIFTLFILLLLLNRNTVERIVNHSPHVSDSFPIAENIPSNNIQEISLPSEPLPIVSWKNF